LSPRIARPSAIAPSTEPPLESSTMVAPRTSRPRTNWSNSRGVSAVIMPLAAMSRRQFVPHASAGPS
jgi:hypothetical protein